MIYLTGATGHIGNNVARMLEEKHTPYRILLRRRGRALAGFSESIMIFGDIFDPEFLSENLMKGDTLVHIAAMVDLLDHYPEETEYVNNCGTRKIIDFCLSRGIRLIYTSTVDCIPREKDQASVNEPEEIIVSRLKCPYTISKGEATAYLLEKMKNDGMDAVILYPSGVVGINDFKPSTAGSEIYLAMKHRFSFYIKGGYNFVDVRDCAKAVISCLEKPVKGSYILAGHNRTLRQFLRAIGKAQKKCKFLVPVPAFLARMFLFLVPRYSDMMIDTICDNYHYDNSRMLSDLVSEPYPFDQTVLDTVKWIKDNENIFK